tara:strand:- start:3187 stop:3954 length:768 start_codon:yes stop_codon:yes gene_type:complete
MKRLFTLRNVALAASLMTMSFVSLATDTTSWNFKTANGQADQWGSGAQYGNEMNFSADGTNLSITAWADTNEVSGDDKIEDAAVSRNGSGLLNYNRHYNDRADEHYVDNKDDTDMLLFTFDDLVSITGINIGYYSDDSDISIAAFDSLPTLQGQTWASVANAASYSASFSNLERSNYSIASSTAGVDSKYWVIGAYNGAFGSPGWTTGNDNLKIAGITTTLGATPKPPTDVAEPSSLAILASFGLFAAWRRKKSI